MGLSLVPRGIQQKFRKKEKVVGQKTPESQMIKVELQGHMDN